MPWRKRPARHQEFDVFKFLLYDIYTGLNAESMSLSNDYLTWNLQNLKFYDLTVGQLMT